MARLASELTGLPVAVMRFRDMDYDAEFDGIWSCASLLHVPLAELVPVVNHFEAALRPGGHWHASFKYGDGETVRGNRTFTNFTEGSFRKLIVPFATLDIVEMRATDDVRSTRWGERWLNVIFASRLRLRRILLNHRGRRGH